MIRLNGAVSVFRVVHIPANWDTRSGRCLCSLDDLSERIRSSHAGGLQGLHMNGWHSGFKSLRSTVMCDYEPTRPREALPTDPDSGNTSGSVGVNSR